MTKREKSIELLFQVNFIRVCYQITRAGSSVFSFDRTH